MRCRPKHLGLFLPPSSPKSIPLEAKGNPSKLLGDHHEADCLIKIKLSNKPSILR
jgi:hypothetical protein